MEGQLGLGVKGEEKKQQELQEPGLQKQQEGGPGLQELQEGGTGLQAQCLLAKMGWRVLARVFVLEQEVEPRELRQQREDGISLCILCKRVRSPRESGLLGQLDSRLLRSSRPGLLPLDGNEDAFCLTC